MMRAPERSPERDAAIEAMLPSVPFDGWTSRALRTALASIGAAPEDAEMLFPGGAADMVEAFCDLADRRMAEAAAVRDMTEMRLPTRVRTLLALRLEQNRPNKEAIRRALSVMALPGNARLAAVTAARTVDAVWRAAGDTSADFSWYTKRAILAAVYGKTLLYWLRDSSDDDAPTLAFLDRRLADVARIGRMRKRVDGFARRFVPSPLRAA
jgi:ubiquinone biosynthesis protein COQ9